MDRIDRAILAELQNDARLSNKQLAAQVGLAPSSCLERVRRLERAGILIGAHAEVIRPHWGLESRHWSVFDWTDTYANRSRSSVSTSIHWTRFWATTT